MKVFNSLLLAGATLLVGQTQAQEDDGAIVGGQNVASNDAYPWMVSLQTQSGSHFCGGSLIAPNIVMTAAHCMTSSSFKVNVKGTAGLKTNSGKDYAVRKIYTHQGYSSSTQNNDIALLELDSEVTDVTPIAYDTTNNNWVGTNTKVIGWGRLSAGGSTPTILQEVVVPVRSTSDCLKGYPNRITNEMVCAGFLEGGKDSCQGDSGGPLFVPGANPTLVGVVSWGYGCAAPNKLGVYARLSSLRPWVEARIEEIKNGVGGEGKCTDDPVGWFDSDGPTYDCDWYSIGTRCSQYGDAYGNDGKEAQQACCACGGGIREDGVAPQASPAKEFADCRCRASGRGTYDKCTEVDGVGYCLINEPGTATPKCKAPAGAQLLYSNNYSQHYLAGCTPSPRLATDEVVAMAPLASATNTESSESPDTQPAPAVDNTPMIVAGVMGAVAGVAMITAGVAVVQLKKAKTADDFSEFRIQNQA